jgi:hypothetical protein
MFTEQNMKRKYKLHSLLFHQMAIYFHACTRFREWHEVSWIAINTHCVHDLDISCKYRRMDGASYTTDTRLSVSLPVGLQRV